jgi:serine/threonine protein kinase
MNKLLSKLTELCKRDPNFKQSCKQNKQSIAKTILDKSDYNTDRISNYSSVLLDIHKRKFKHCNLAFLHVKPINSPLNNYKVERILGAGGQGCVYLARDVRDGSLVILKSGQDLENEKRILKLLKCNKKFFPCYLNSFTENNQEYIVSKPFFESSKSQAPASDLFSFLQRKNLTDKNRRDIYLKILKAVQYLEKNDIKHKDLKPENILISEDGVGKGTYDIQIIDFGMACFRKDLICSYGHTSYYQPPDFVPPSTYSNISELYSLVIILGDIVYPESLKSTSDFHIETFTFTGNSFYEKLLNISPKNKVANLKALFSLLKQYCVTQNCNSIITLDELIKFI